MAFIDTTYFIRNIHLPVDECPDLDSYIEMYEPEILKRVLGFHLWKLFNDNEGLYEPEQKWIDLRDGCTYTVNDIDYEWIGFKNAAKESLIAYYVFFQYTRYSSSFNSGSGLRTAQSENSVISDYRYKQAWAYNRMIDIIEQMDAFINEMNSIDDTTYPEYSPEKIRRVNIFNV